MYAGFVNGRFHTWHEKWTDARTHKTHSHVRCAIFMRKAQAKREYEDVREVSVSLIGKGAK